MAVQRTSMIPFYGCSVSFFFFFCFQWCDDCVSHGQPTVVVVVVDHHSANSNRKWREKKPGSRKRERRRKNCGCRVHKNNVIYTTWYSHNVFFASCSLTLSAAPVATWRYYAFRHLCILVRRRPLHFSLLDFFFFCYLLSLWLFIFCCCCCCGCC